MKKRVIFGALALLLFLPVLYFGGVALDFVVGFLAMLAVAEVFRMKGLEIFSFEGFLAMLGAFVLAVPIGHYFTALPLDASLIAFALIAFLLLSGLVFTFPNYHFEDATFAIGTSFYLGFGFQQLINARLVGFERVLFVLAIIWATDIGAYTIGMALGKRRLAPRVSPNKSLAGFWGGILSAVLVGSLIIVLKKSVVPYNLFQMLPLIALFSGVAQFGDLVESAIKRQYGVKDSGTFLPGHGGVFDRFDSVIFVLPLMHFFGLF